MFSNLHMIFNSLTTPLLPLAIYLIFLGLLNLGPRPKVFTGRLDRMYLYAGVSGLVIYGPIQILLPSNAVIRFGDHVWYPMMVLYFFGVLAISMVSRPQLVIYNLSYQDFSLLLSRVKKREVWMEERFGNVIQIIDLEIQFEITSVHAMKSVSLCATRGNQSNLGWHELHKMLRRELISYKASPNGFGWIYLASGLVLAAMVGWTSVSMA